VGQVGERLRGWHANTFQAPASGYSDFQRQHMSEVISSMLATHKVIRTLLDAGGDEPQGVDVLALARLQLEGLYNTCLMFEGPQSYLARSQDLLDATESSVLMKS
jgi:hypothetical protein